MAKGGGSRARPGRSGRDASGKRPAKGGAKPGAKSKSGTKPQPKRVPRPSPGPSPEAAAPPMPTRFALGTIPGSTPGKWIDAWNDRMPGTAIELVALTVADQRRALVDGEVDAAIVRLPLDADGLHVISLYDEVPVVVASTESHLLAAEELTLADLAGEVLVVPQDDVLGIRVPESAAPRFSPPTDTAEAIATVAAGVGFVVVPMSLARMHHRKDAEYRPLTDGPTSTVALAWVAERTTPAVEAFIGIVRGRTANSSRG